VKGSDARYWAFALGLFLVFYAVFTAPASQHYVSALADWNYMRSFTLPTVSDVSSVYVVPLPHDANFWAHVNPDCSDVRVTVGRGTTERLLPTEVLSCHPDENVGTVAFLYSGSSRYFRLYYGNKDVVASPFFVSPTLLSGDVYRAPRFDPADWNVQMFGNQWGVARFTHSRLYLLRWGRGLAVLSPQFSLPPAFHIALRFYAGGWGHGDVYIPLSDCSVRAQNVDPLRWISNVEQTCSSGILIRSVDDGYAHVVVYDHGSVVASRRLRHYFTIALDENGEGTVVRFGSTSVYVASHPSVLSFYVAGYRESTYLRLDAVLVRVNVLKTEHVSFSPELITPKSPKVVLTPSDGTYFNDVNVPVSLRVTDPNCDLVSVSLSFDGNTLVSADLNRPSCSYAYSGELNDLSDGSHTLSYVATDEEGLKTSDTYVFHVDTVPPELNVTDLNITDGNVSFHVSASDPNLAGCYYYVNTDKNTESIPCDANVSISARAGDHIVVWAQDKAGNVTIKKINVPARRSSTCSCVVVVFAGKPPSSSASGSVSHVTPTTVSHIVSQQASPSTLPKPSSVAVWLVVAGIIVSLVFL